MPLKDWSELPGNAPQVLEIPINGQVYAIPEPGARIAGNLIAMQAALREHLDKVQAAEDAGEEPPGLDTETGLNPGILYEGLGDAYAEMVEDDVPAAALLRAAQAVAAWCINGSKEAAEAVWEGKAETVMGSRRERRATTTRSPASGRSSATTRSTTRQPRKAAKASGGRGRKSSATGG